MPQGLGLRASQRFPRSRRRAGGERGTALLEFALVAMVFFMIIFGIIDFSRLMHAWVTVQHAAREGARYGVTGQVACDGYATREDCIRETAEEATTGLSDAPGNVVVSFRSWGYPDYDPGSLVEGSAGDQCDALEVEVDYDFEFAAPIISNVLGSVTLPIRGRERLVNEPFGPCG